VACISSFCTGLPEILFINGLLTLQLEIVLETIEVICSCGRNYKVSADYAGRRGKCPACGNSILVSEPSRRPPGGADAEVGGRDAGPPADLGGTAVGRPGKSFQPEKPNAGSGSEERRTRGVRGITSQLTDFLDNAKLRFKNSETKFAEIRAKTFGAGDRRPGEADPQRLVRNLTFLVAGVLIAAVLLLGWFWIKGSEADSAYRELQARLQNQENLRLIQGQYEAYVSKYPESRHAAELRPILKGLPARIEARDYEVLETRLNGLGESYEEYEEPLKRFLAEHPNGAHAQAARIMLRELPAKIEERDFNRIRARLEDSTGNLEVVHEDLANFIRTYPRGAYAEEAITILEELPAMLEELDARELFARLDEASGTLGERISLIEEFLNRHPSGAYAEPIRERLRELHQSVEDGDFQRALSQAEQGPEAKKRALEEFLGSYPEGRNAAAARSMIENFPNEYADLVKERLSEVQKREDWTKCQETCLSFVKRFPSHPATSYFRSMMIRCERLDIPARSGSRPDEMIRAYEAFVRKYQEGPEVDEARRQRDLLTGEEEDRFWVSVLSSIEKDPGNVSVVEGLLQNYLRAYPAGKYSDEARNRLASLKNAEQKRAQAENWLSVKNRSLESGSVSQGLNILEEFLREHPSGPYTQEAISQIVALELQRFKSAAPLPSGEEPYVVHLSDGTSLSGTLTKTHDGRVVLRDAAGDRYFLSPEKILRTDLSPQGALMREYNARLEGVDPTVPGSFKSLAGWAEQSGFRSRALMCRVLAAYLDPKDRESTEILRKAGFTYVHGRWKSRDSLWR